MKTVLKAEIQTSNKIEANKRRARKIEIEILLLFTIFFICC